MEQVSPKISVITVCFNAAEQIEQTIQSVLNQDYPNIEYIIIDGGSKDSTMRIVDKYSAHLSYCVSEKDNGIYNAMNKGIAHATGEWIIFRNAGDPFVSDHTLSEIFACPVDESVDVLHGDCIYVNVWGWKRAKPAIIYDDKVWKKSMPVLHPASFVRTSVHKMYPFDEQFRISGDFDLFHRLLSDNKRFEYRPVPVAYFETGGFAMSHLKRTFKEDAYIRSGRSSRHMSLKELPPYFVLCVKLTLLDIVSRSKILASLRRKDLEKEGWKPLPYEK